MPLTRSELMEILSYDQETGVFVWLQSPGQRAMAGDVAGGLNHGYIRIKVKGKSYRAHRLAWLYMTGEFPKEEIDHKDGNKTNNAFDNLRQATRLQNSQNRRKQSNNRSGYKGVHWSKAAKKWRACCYCNGRQINLGLFESEQEAGNAYLSYAKENYGEFFNSGGIDTTAIRGEANGRAK